MDLAWLDSLKFEPIPAPVRYYDTPRLSINEKGQMAMNPVFLREAGENLCFYGGVSEDGRCITLRPSKEGQTCFTAKGAKKNEKFSRLLGRRGIKFPVTYSMEWVPERELWFGCSGDLPKPPQAKTLLPKRRGGRLSGT